MTCFHTQGITGIYVSDVDADFGEAVGGGEFSGRGDLEGGRRGRVGGGEAHPVEGSCDGEAGELDSAAEGQDCFDVVEVDLAEVSFGEGDGAADQAAGLGDAQRAA